MSFSHQHSLVASQRGLRDCKFPVVSRTLLSILADLNNVVVWMVLILPLISRTLRSILSNVAGISLFWKAPFYLYCLILSWYLLNLLLLPTFFSCIISCIISFSAVFFFFSFFRSFHFFASLCIFSFLFAFACSRSFYICSLSLISRPTFILLIGFLSRIPTLSRTRFPPALD